MVKWKIVYGLPRTPSFWKVQITARIMCHGVGQFDVKNSATFAYLFFLRPGNGSQHFRNLLIFMPKASLINILSLSYRNKKIWHINNDWPCLQLDDSCYPTGRAGLHSRATRMGVIDILLCNLLKCRALPRMNSYCNRITDKITEFLLVSSWCLVIWEYNL